MSNILSNIAALKSLYHLNRNEEGYATSIERISSGKRINTAGDDAAGASIVNRMTSQITGMQVAIRNAGDAISMAQTAEGAMNECSEILHRMRELAVQAANGTYSGADRVALNAEVVELKNELLRISETTKFNDVKLINGDFRDTTFEIGYDESPGHAHNLSIESVKPTDLGMWKTTTQLNKTVTATAVHATDGTITTDVDHLFQAGDLITYEQGAQPILGLVDGQTYLVDLGGAASNSFKLKEIDGAAVTYKGGTSPWGTGVGAKFHLASLAGAPSVVQIGTDTASSMVNKSEDITIHGHVGSQKIDIGTSMTAKEIAAAVFARESVTGVRATAQTNAKLTVTPNNNTDDYTVVSFKIRGMNSEAADAKLVAATIKFGTTDGLRTADLSDLRDKINGISGNTGIQAVLASDKTSIHLKSPDGYDIIIEDVDFPAKTAAAVKTTTIAGSKITHGTETFTVDAGHGYTTGDAIKLVSASNAAQADIGLDMGKTYTVVATSSTDFTLKDPSNNNADVLLSAGLAAGTDTVTFHKVEKSLNLQTLDRNQDLKGGPVTLVDKELGDDEAPNMSNSARISGEVQYESAYVFTLVPDVKTNGLFRDAPPAATLDKISEMDILTVDNSHRMLTSIDGALKRVDAERGDLGATMNRMTHTIDNLSNIVVNSSASRSRIQDADMALETAELAKSQILQQAATAMVGQANKALQTVLSLLR